MCIHFLPLNSVFLLNFQKCRVAVKKQRLMKMVSSDGKVGLANATSDNIISKSEVSIIYTTFSLVFNRPILPKSL